MIKILGVSKFYDCDEMLKVRDAKGIRLLRRDELTGENPRELMLEINRVSADVRNWFDYEREFARLGF